MTARPENTAILETSFTSKHGCGPNPILIYRHRPSLVGRPRCCDAYLLLRDVCVSGIVRRLRFSLLVQMSNWLAGPDMVLFIYLLCYWRIYCLLAPWINAEGEGNELYKTAEVIWSVFLCRAWRYTNNEYSYSYKKRMKIQGNILECGGTRRWGRAY